ncbi:hypothetical protein QW71_03125 [Paenibacillus sp. IHB B 3415]|uniref:DUF4867 family protein n=1 Tax=Paenibacillus sp. IHB B 3415 TaxID=867080 RepID=UPI000573639A|nr:DUF4867 family protein [Paenibacillus sp. IHB B 3415]KHL97160.1 hypothetical protein QW71_03125 [Paenibacillus sp. IHB B 3415]
MIIEQLREKNKELDIQDVSSSEFANYGNLLTGINVNAITIYARDKFTIPAEGNQYVASVAELEGSGTVRRIRDEVFGELPVQIGFCAGRNTKLTGVEYHQGSEVVIAVTDCIHLLGRRQDIRANTYDSGQIKAFYQPKNTAIELYSTTLHYAPCKVTDEGYLTLVVLPAGTNAPLDSDAKERSNILLTKKNKFLMVHATQKEKIAAGVYPGLLGHMVHFESL